MKLDLNLNNIRGLIDEDEFLCQRKICKKLFFEMKDDKTTHRKIFTLSSLQLSKNNGKCTFSVNFGNTIIPIFYSDTGIKLNYSNIYNNFWTYVSDNEINTIKKWEKTQGTRVFLRDLLFCSIALNMNYETEAKRTSHGEVFYMLKYDQNNNRYKDCLNWVINEFCNAITSLPYYNKCKFICAVPPRPKKTFDLPSVIAQNIANKLKLTDITSNFIYGSSRPQVKECSLNEKWNAWEKADISVNIANINNEDIILIDDLYQSGVSVNFIAMKLQEAGFEKICGLYFVKSRKDTDNT